MRIKRQDPHSLVVGMTGVKLGDQVLQYGCANGAPLAAVAAKVGLSGRAVAAVTDEESAARVQKAAAKAGVLVEVEVVRDDKLPFDAGTFDLAIVDDTGGGFAALRPEDRLTVVRELARVVRPGGRAMVDRPRRAPGISGAAVAGAIRSVVRRVRPGEQSARSRRLPRRAHAGRTRRAGLRGGD